MKHSLSDLKKIVMEHKKSIPILSSGKNTLFAYAIKHKLIDAETHLHNEKIHEMASKKERDLEEKDLHEALEKIDKKHKKMRAEKVDKVEKPKMVHNLKEVQKIRKEKGVSLKEAWSIYLNDQKSKK